MEITTEQALIDEGRKILEKHLGDIHQTPGYLGWRMVEAVDFLPRTKQDVEMRSLFLLVRVDGDTPFKLAASHIEKVEEKAYSEFAELVLQEDLEGKVNIFIFLDFEEEI